MIHRHRLATLVVSLGLLAACQDVQHASPGSSPASASTEGQGRGGISAPSTPDPATPPAGVAVAGPASSNTTATTPQSQEGTAQADTLERRFLLHFMPKGPQDRQALEERVTRHLLTATTGGRFQDITYKPHLGNADSTGWGEHLLRVVDLAMAWRLEGGPFHQDARLPPLIRAGMESYIATPFDFSDQWGYGHPYGDLMETKRLGIVCLCAHRNPQVFPQADIERWADRIPPFIDTYRGNFLEGGANLLWTAWGEIAGALVREDQQRRLARVDDYFRLLWSSMLTRAGRTSIGGCPRLTWDHMLGEHDVPCMGSYGEWYVNDVLVYDDITRGLPRWTMPEQVVRLWIDVLLDGVAFCYQGAVDPHLANPAFWLNARPDGNAVLRTWLHHFEGRGYRSQEVSAVLDWTPGKDAWPLRERSVGAFPTVDFMTKHFDRWMWSGRAVSERTLGLETFDQTDLHRATRSGLLPYGACFLRASGRTLQDQQLGAIWDAYDFGRPSGMTTRHADAEALSGLWNRDVKGRAVRRNRGSTPYSGMAALPHTGVMAWWQGRDVVVDEGHGCQKKTTDILTPGRHAVFILENAVVHLGADLDTRHDRFDTLTSVEQRLSHAGPIRYGLRDGADRDAAAGSTLTGPDVAWVWYDEVLYVPPLGITTIQDAVQRGPQGSTSWMADAKGVKSPRTMPPQERPVFSIFTNHGRTQEHLNLSWAILPGIDRAEAATAAARTTWTILANTAQIQALSVPAKSWIGAAFHQPGSLPAAGGMPALEVDRPLILNVERRGDVLHVAAADPMGTAGTAIITIAGQPIPVELPHGDRLGFTQMTSLAAEGTGWRRLETASIPAP